MGTLIILGIITQIADAISCLSNLKFKRYGLFKKYKIGNKESENIH